MFSKNRELMTIMLIGIVMLISFPTVINANFDASNKTYGDLALKSGPTAFNKSLGLLNTLNETTMPDFVRPLRKSLLVIRNILDLFIFAYPLQSEKNDTFHVLRKDVNDGYTFVGNFQDLAHMGVNYTQKQLNQRREICLNWKQKYIQDETKFEYMAYLQSASTSQIFNRNDSLSPFFWGGVSVRPTLSLTGYQNLALLSSALFNESILHYQVVLELKHPWKNHPEFHAFRKLTRGIISINTQFPKVFANTSSASVSTEFENNESVDVGDVDYVNENQDYFGKINFETKMKIRFQNLGDFNCSLDNGIEVLNDVYDTFGDINDVLNEVEYYEQQGNKTAADIAKKQSDADWVVAKKWLQAYPLEVIYSCLQLYLIPY